MPKKIWSGIEKSAELSKPVNAGLAVLLGGIALGIPGPNPALAFGATYNAIQVPIADRIAKYARKRKQG